MDVGDLCIGVMTKQYVINPQKSFEDTLTSLWLGAGKASGNLTGALGAGLQSIGQMFEPTEEQLARQRELYSSIGEYVGLPEHLRMNGYTPPNPNAITQAGNYLLGLNTRVQSGVNQAREDLLGDEQGVYSRAMEGIGEMLIPFLFYGTAGGGALGKGAKALAEAGTETGALATDMYKNGHIDRNSAKAWLNNFLANLGLSAGLELTPDGSKWLTHIAPNREWSQSTRLIADILKELIEEGAVQNPMQKMIYDGTANTAQ